MEFENGSAEKEHSEIWSHEKVCDCCYTNNDSLHLKFQLCKINGFKGGGGDKQECVMSKENKNLKQDKLAHSFLA